MIIIESKIENEKQREKTNVKYLTSGASPSEVPPYSTSEIVSNSDEIKMIIIYIRDSVKA